MWARNLCLVWFLSDFTSSPFWTTLLVRWVVHKSPYPSYPIPLNFSDHMSDEVRHYDFPSFRRFSWSLTLSNPIVLPPAYSRALIYFGRGRDWWVTCNYPRVLKEKNINRTRKSTTCAICWLTSVLHDHKRREQETHNVGLLRCAFCLLVAG
jgi:hypothetical protein